MSLLSFRGLANRIRLCSVSGTTTFRLRYFAVARALAAFVIVCTVSAKARAADPSAGDRETSRNLGLQGLRAIDAHDYAAAELACGGAYALVKAPTVGTCWARALEGLGRLVEARDVFIEVTHFPAKLDEPTVFTTARDAARTEADGLAKRIPTLTLVIFGPSESTPLRVALDGAIVKSETARLPRRVNPGSHTLSVSAPGFEAATVHIAVAEGEDRRLEVSLRSSSESPEANSVQPAPPERSTDRGSLPVPAIVAGGVSLAGLVVGVGAGVAGSSKHSALSGECNKENGTCPPSAASDLDTFHSLRTLSTVGYVGGALGLVTGGVLFFLMPASKESPASTGLYVGPASCGVAGVF
jgi:hypothetical protein